METATTHAPPQTTSHTTPHTGTHNLAALSHPLRVPLAAELHSRPFLHLDAPEAITHLAVWRGDQHLLLASLCAHFGVPAPVAGASHFYHDFGRLRLKWECHTEFASYTFTTRLPGDVLLAARSRMRRWPTSRRPGCSSSADG